MRDLFFCPERWEPDAMVSTNIASRVRVKNFRGSVTDAWQLADWWYNWTSIISKIPIEKGWLESGEQYRFCFWLNGGENDRRDEVCSLEIFGDSWEDRLCFKLNREQTKPILEKNGWLLFAVPFTAPEASDALTFRFVAAGAVCTITGIPDLDMAACESLTPDPRSFDRPQRHNIVFPHGWPDEQPRRVVLKGRSGRALTLPRKAVAAAAAVGAAVLTAALVHAVRKKK